MAGAGLGLEVRVVAVIVALPDPVGEPPEPGLADCSRLTSTAQGEVAAFSRLSGLGVRGDFLFDCFSLLRDLLGDCTDPCTDEPKAKSTAVLSERGGSIAEDTAAGSLVTEAGTDDVTSDTAVGEAGLEPAQFNRGRPAGAVCCGMGADKEKKRIEEIRIGKNTPFGIDLQTSQVLYRAAQAEE
ncbi:MAG: hypothetical protein FRX49_03547 [Trebouxia sp. A1-2]|nr:MAG: hypothetical protein FRX49_03547 [Trebouxia sp. A1-2]